MTTVKNIRISMSDNERLSIESKEYLAESLIAELWRGLKDLEGLRIDVPHIFQSNKTIIREIKNITERL